MEHHTQKWFPDSVVAAEMVVPASQKEKSPSLVLFVAKEQGIQEHSGDSLDTLFRPLNENFQVIAQEMEEKLRDELLRYVIPTAVIPLVNSFADREDR